MNFIQENKNTENRSKRMFVRISPVAKDVIEGAAKITNVPTSEILRVGAALWIKQHVGEVANVDVLLG